VEVVEAQEVQAEVLVVTTVQLVEQEQHLQYKVLMVV
jgi:hypothetical protein